MLPAQLWPLRHHLLLGQTLNYWTLLLLLLLLVHLVHLGVVFIIQDDHCRNVGVVRCECALSHGQVWTELRGERCGCICILTAVTTPVNSSNHWNQQHQWGSVLLAGSQVSYLLFHCSVSDKTKSDLPSPGQKEVRQSRQTDQWQQYFSLFSPVVKVVTVRKRKIFIYWLIKQWFNITLGGIQRKNKRKIDISRTIIIIGHYEHSLKKCGNQLVFHLWQGLLLNSPSLMFSINYLFDYLFCYTLQIKTCTSRIVLNLINFISQWERERQQLKLL